MTVSDAGQNGSTFSATGSGRPRCLRRSPTRSPNSLPARCFFGSRAGWGWPHHTRGLGSAPLCADTLRHVASSNWRRWTVRGHGAVRRSAQPHGLPTHGCADAHHPRRPPLHVDAGPHLPLARRRALPAAAPAQDRQPAPDHLGRGADPSRPADQGLPAPGRCQAAAPGASAQRAQEASRRVTRTGRPPNSARSETFDR